MTLTQGYEKRATQLITETQTMYEEYQQAQTDLQSFQRLEVEFGCELAGFLLRRGTANRIGGVLISVLVVQASEAVALPRRVEALDEEIELVTKREVELQQRYARLQYELANMN